MSSVVLIGESQEKILGGTPYYKRKIKCPAHYLIPPNVDIYKREPVNELRNVSRGIIQEYKLKRYRRKKDIFGRPIIDWKKLYELKAKGIVKQPMVSASFAIENIYDSKSIICRMCRKRCMEGKGKITETTIKRLNG